MITKIPFSIFPENIMKKHSFHFMSLASNMEKTLTGLQDELIQNEIAFGAKDYLSRVLFLSFSYFAILTIVLLIVGVATGSDLIQTLVIAFGAGAMMGFLVFVNLVNYPKLLALRKIKAIETEWINALRTILVQIKAGLTLFDALVVIAEGDYGIISKEIRKAVEKINTGQLEEQALEELARNNPSNFFRRSVWQLINGMNSGADTSSILEEIVRTMTQQQIIEIKKYGARLGMLTLVYVMLGVIVPALGITFLIVLSNFPQVHISQTLFWLLLLTIIIVEFMFLGVMKTSRPGIIGD